MIVTEKGDEPRRVELPDGRVAWLSAKDNERAQRHYNRTSVGGMGTIVQTMLEVEAEDAEDTRRRWLLVRMAVHGEFSGIARQLKLWGVEACE